jgi:hypothetical protein
MALTTVRFRPLFGRVLAGVVAAVALVGLGGFVVSGDWPGLVRYAWPIVLFAVLGWALYWRPQLIVEEHGITVVNVLRTFFVPWPAIQRIDTRWALTLYTTAGRIPVWAAPAPGRHSAARVSKGDLSGVAESAYGRNQSLRPSDALSTESGSAAHVIRRHWEALRDTGRLEPGVQPGSLTVRWHLGTIAGMGALLIAAIVGLLV